MQGGLGLISGVDVYHLLAGHAASSMVHHRINAAIPAAYSRRASLFTVTAFGQQRAATACSQCGAAGKLRQQQLSWHALHWPRASAGAVSPGSTIAMHNAAGLPRLHHSHGAKHDPRGDVMVVP